MTQVISKAVFYTYICLIISILKYINMSNKSCPISPELVNETLVRSYSFVTFFAISVYLFTPFKEVIFISAIDFIIRVVIGVKYSPICNIIKLVLKTGNFPSHMINAGPKKFAAKIGLIITVLMSLSVIFDFQTTSVILGIISFTAVGAEAIFGYCVACKVHSFLPERWQ